jgi:four helix bundle protein
MVMTQRFDHEKLRVYQESLKFIVVVQDLFEQIPKRMAVYDQLDRASTSIALNIAEGNGKFTEKDRCRFFDIARGSALECAACLDVLAARNVLSQDEIEEAKERLMGIVSMLVGLIKSNSSSRAYEVPAEYGVGC